MKRFGIAITAVVSLFAFTACDGIPGLTGNPWPQAQAPNRGPIRVGGDPPPGMDWNLLDTTVDSWAGWNIFQWDFGSPQVTFVRYSPIYGPDGTRRAAGVTNNQQTIVWDPSMWQAYDTGLYMHEWGHVLGYLEDPLCDWTNYDGVLDNCGFWYNETDENETSYRDDWFGAQDQQMLINNGYR